MTDTKKRTFATDTRSSLQVQRVAKAAVSGKQPSDNPHADSIDRSDNQRQQVIYRLIDFLKSQ